MGTKNDKFTTLLKSAKNMEEGVNNIKSVADPAPVPEPTLERVIIPEESENKEKRRNKKELSEKNQISFLFEKSDKEDNRSEAVRIPADIHRKLKLLASCSNTSIALIFSKILHEFVDSNETSIQNYIKSVIK